MFVLSEAEENIHEAKNIFLLVTNSHLKTNYTTNQITLRSHKGRK